VKTYPHKYKHGKQTEPMEFKDFRMYVESGLKVDRERDMAFLYLLFYLGCRVRALLELRKGTDVTVEENDLVFKLKPLKHGIREVPLRLPLILPYMDQITQYSGTIKEGEKLFPFSYTTAWRIVKRIFPEKYTHYFRLNRCTQFLDDPEATLPEIKTWFGWKRAETVTAYIGSSPRHIRKGSQRLVKETIG